MSIQTQPSKHVSIIRNVPIWDVRLHKAFFDE